MRGASGRSSPNKTAPQEISTHSGLVGRFLARPTGMGREVAGVGDTCFPLCSDSSRHLPPGLRVSRAVSSGAKYFKDRKRRLSQAATGLGPGV